MVDHDKASDVTTSTARNSPQVHTESEAAVLFLGEYNRGTPRTGALLDDPIFQHFALLRFHFLLALLESFVAAVGPVARLRC